MRGAVDAGRLSLETTGHLWRLHVAICNLCDALDKLGR